MFLLGMPLQQKLNYLASACVMRRGGQHENLWSDILLEDHPAPVIKFKN
jgi:hypothetical protein